MRLLPDDDGPEVCGCEPSFEGDRLAVDSGDCTGGGRLASDPDCRATVVDALAEREAEAVVTTAAGIERAYEDEAAALLVAAGRFVQRIADRDARLADRARHDPLGAATAATGRAGPIARAAAETGLGVAAEAVETYEDGFRPATGPTVARSRVRTRPPAEARLVESRDLPTGATVRRYECEDRQVYHLTPDEHTFDDGAAATLAAAHDRLVAGVAGTGRRAPRRAVGQVTGPGDPDRLVAALGKHTQGYGVFEDLFADERVTDAFVTPPAAANPVRVRVGDRTLPTNVRLTGKGVATMASAVRRTSGRAFSRASPTVDASVEIADDDVRVAGVAEPFSEGYGFALRRHDADPWSLAALVANGTLPAAAAGLLSVAVERGATALLAGSRGAGKTTTLGALLWELPRETRTVLVEDTPELPVDALQAAGRDVQGLRVGDGGTTPSATEAVRTALRLGEGALVVGEVRGEEASALYEAMRVGDADSAVLGTVHGETAADVRERVVEDLDVTERAFAATDLLVTLGTRPTPDGRRRRVTRITEVTATGDGVATAALYEYGDTGLAATGRIDRGRSRLVDGLARPGESAANVRESVEERAAAIERRADRGHTAPEGLA
jgi:type IV secretory pathway ATPase VirB11/archaellum biosynthesis ATPase